MFANNNNALLPQYIRPAQEVEHQHPLNQHLIIQIEPDAAPVAPQENAHPHPANAIQNRRPGWVNRMAQGIWNGGAQLAGDSARMIIRLRNGYTPMLLSCLAAMECIASIEGALMQTFDTDGYEGDPRWAPILGYGAVATFFLMMGLEATRYCIPDQDDAADADAGRDAAANDGLRDIRLAGRPIDAVVCEVRGLRAGPSSSASTSFDWTQGGLFVDRNGIDRTAEVSHLFNRILHSLKGKDKDEQVKISSARVALFNNLLDSLEKEPDHRAGLANQVVQINATCIDRATTGFNIMMRQLGVYGRENMLNRNFLLNVMRDAVFAAADKELLDHLKETGRKPVSEDYQAIYCLVAKKLREKIPDFPQVMEQLKYKATLSNEESNTIADAVIKKFDNPMQIAQRLYESSKQNQAMAERFNEELKEIGENIDKKLDEKCEAFTKSEGREPSLEEMGEFAIALKSELQEAQTELYAQLIADASLFSHSTSA